MGDFLLLKYVSCKILIFDCVYVIRLLFHCMRGKRGTILTVWNNSMHIIHILRAVILLFIPSDSVASQIWKPKFRLFTQSSRACVIFRRHRAEEKLSCRSWRLSGGRLTEVFLTGVFCGRDGHSSFNVDIL